jgi:hypothetical protein
MADQWRERKRSAPSAPVRPTKRPARTPKPRALLLDDPDDWIVKDAPAPSKLTCSPPDVEVSAITTKTASELKAPTATVGLTMEELLVKYPPLSIRPANPEDDWF